MKKLLDANVIIRYLTQDDPHKASRFIRLLQNNKDEYVLLDVVVAEIVWVLESHYEISKIEIVQKLQALIATATISSRSHLILLALGYFKNHSVDYIDAYLAAVAHEEKIAEIISYDEDLDKIKSVERIEP